jgi:hypothetical protein
VELHDYQEKPKVGILIQAKDAKGSRLQEIEEPL